METFLSLTFTLTKICFKVLFFHQEGPSSPLLWYMVHAFFGFFLWYPLSTLHIKVHMTVILKLHLTPNIIIYFKIHLYSYIIVQIVWFANSVRVKFFYLIKNIGKLFPPSRFLNPASPIPKGQSFEAHPFSVDGHVIDARRTERTAVARRREDVYLKPSSGQRRVHAVLNCRTMAGN